jgi:hypothetical protein
MWWLILLSVFRSRSDLQEVETLIALVLMVGLSLVPTTLCFLLFRSGLRGPFAPEPELVPTRR